MKEAENHRFLFKRIQTIIISLLLLSTTITAAVAASPLSESFIQRSIKSRGERNQPHSLGTIENMASVLRQRKNINVRGGSDEGITGSENTITAVDTAVVQQHDATSKSEQDGGGDEKLNTGSSSSSISSNEQKQVEDYKPSKLRSAIFPIYGTEVKKFVLMGAIKFFVIMALTLTRDTKDTLVVTQCGAEAIAFLKVSPRNVYITSILLHIVIF